MEKDPTDFLLRAAAEDVSVAHLLWHAWSVGWWAGYRDAKDHEYRTSKNPFDAENLATLPGALTHSSEPASAPKVVDFPTKKERPSGSE